MKSTDFVAIVISALCAVRAFLLIDYCLSTSQSYMIAILWQCLSVNHHISV